VLRAESKIRARALQLLYAWDVTNALSLQVIAAGFGNRAGRMADVIAAAELLADNVVADVDRLDAEIGSAADNWRLERIGAVERNILRLAVYELHVRAVPPRVAIDEAIQLAHWFAGPKAPGFVNGVLDTIARRMGCL
jgi:N utilization substance protein B